MSAPVLDVRNLSVSYLIGKQRARAAADISFTLSAGERLGIVGESGSGKSTLALALMRLHKPPARIDAGEAWLAGTDIMRLEGEELRRFRWSEISLVPQGAMNSLNPVMRIRKQLADAIEAHWRDWSRAKIQARVQEMLERVGLSPKVGDLYPHELSGGMKQRVCIALAVVLEPKLIIADEPTSALDVVVQRLVIQTLKDVQEQIGAALIMIGHDMGLMAQSVDRLAVMYAGRMVDIAPVRDFFHRPLHPYSQLLISSLPSLDETKPLTGIPGMQPSLFDLPGGCSFHPRCPSAKDLCRQTDPAFLPTGPGRGTACHVVRESLDESR
ncbi:ABC transporter ATP-binding protein [Pleomorphomonas koreensis]|uniref:ABC transporter ATP-binding protein n=1 Tax=Pleomorphomonas koreensis TaxID=257440 RepID=UPI00040C7DE0|nr:ABC transporter ATP-binding protein [Pleomorphomonas koreensis]